MTPMSTVNNNSISLAGEFAVLSQLALRGYDANMTLGRTKSVDILVSNPESGKMYQLEVKTNFRNTRNQLSVSKVHGKTLSGWMMSKKHETTIAPNLLYCFVNISKDTSVFKFYILPSKVVAKYVKEEHALWLDAKKTEGKAVKETDMRIFRVGTQTEKYPIATPCAEQYENKWDLLG
jgi:hypothetical protein